MSIKAIGNIHVGSGEYDVEAGRNYDKNYDAVFGKAREENAKRPAADRAREAADSGKKRAGKVQARTARMRAMGDRKAAEMAKEDEVAKKGG